jgi:hypothetical protein
MDDSLRGRSLRDGLSRRRVLSTHADSVRCALAEVISAFLEARGSTSSSRVTDRRVLGELARDLGRGRPADSIGADELAAWFVRARDPYAPATWNRDRSLVRALQALGAPLDLPAIGYRRLRPAPEGSPASRGIASST